MSRLLFISIKQKYVDKILSGEKTIELRKSKPSVKSGDIVIIYSTKPVMAITAIATVEELLIASPSEIWKNFKQETGVTETEYFEYYKTSTKAVGIRLSNVRKLTEEILLSAIKMLHPDFVPPQTFKYLNKFETLRDYKNLTD